MNPRVRGIREHLDRVRAFLDLSKEVRDGTSAFRLQIAAVYSCRAIAEIMLSAAERQQVRAPEGTAGFMDRDTLEQLVVSRLAHYRLIEKIRIHDFHRFGLLPPSASGEQDEMWLGGPVKLVGQGGSAAIYITEAGVETFITANAAVKLQRPLLIRNGTFFDEELDQWKSLAEIVLAFLDSAPDVISTFERMILV